MTAPEIKRDVQGAHGRYTVEADGKTAELTYSTAAPGVISADHTYVPPEFRGRGIAEALVARLVADARAEGVRILPRCSYVEVQRRRHPDWADAFQA